ncbi:heme ABC exporter ATP-binding protein CcmA [Sneathiella litorea]|uniref:Heme ABC exporter ATP-binding protein CcmA n=1 Tax=Sneathiella litorea TaxID=2606216 RepID=A0A6L8W395_9PROT|nr:heme ABC exporter ATP-binding protein CcmA [Sneathiella litorea]MZR29481.1 heme ABC exporter ATP-binding protein CcmA [Sneathiella litorea]
MSFAVRNLACQRAEQLVFENVSFSLASGEAIWVRGRNGAGKSSLLRICARLLSPLAGEITWNDEDIFKDSETYVGSYHYLGHQEALKYAMTVRENIGFWSMFHGTEDVVSALEQFDLQKLADTPTGLLSQGQKKRTNLARLVASSAKLWILDEPLSALDKHYIALFKERLMRHLAAGGMALFATHQDLELEQVKLLDLDDGAL